MNATHTPMITCATCAQLRDECAEAAKLVAKYEELHTLQSQVIRDQKDHIERLRAALSQTED